MLGFHRVFAVCPILSVKHPPPAMQSSKLYPVAQVSANPMGSASTCSSATFRRGFIWRENCFLLSVTAFLLRHSGLYPAGRRHRWPLWSTSKLQIEAEHLVCWPPTSGGDTLRDQTKERWRELCERVLIEQDPHRFEATIQELLRVLEDHEDQRRNALPSNRNAAQ